LNAQWVQAGWSNYGVNSFAVSGNNFFAATYEGVYLSTNNGASWNAINSGLQNNEVNCFTVKDTNLFAGTYNGVYLSTNNGTNWNAEDSGLANTGVTALAVSGDKIFAGTTGGVFVSTNNGANWTAAGSGLPDTLIIPAVSALIVFPNGAGDTNLFAGMTGSGVYLLTNNGTNWIAVDSGLNGNIDIYSLATSPDGKNIFAGTGRGVYCSTNNGTSWNSITSGLPSYEPNTYALIVISNGKGDTTLFAGTTQGVWAHPISRYTPIILLDQYSLGFYATSLQTITRTLRITTSSLTPLIIDSVYTKTKWYTVESVHDTISEGDTVNLNISLVMANDTTSYSDTLYIVSNSICSPTKVSLGGGIEYPISVSKNNSDIPKNYEISQNFPNPFNPTTVINYQIPVSSFVTLKVYDILGREVATLVNARKNAGYFNVTFDSKHLPSGVYFYRLQASSFIQTKKFVLLK